MTPAPESRARVRGYFDRLEHRLAFSDVSVRGGLRLAAGIGALRNILSGRWPSSADVAALYDTAPAESWRVAQSIAALEAKSRQVLIRAGGRPLAPFAELVRWRDPAVAWRIPPRTVLVTAHIGAHHLLALPLDQLGIRRTILRAMPWHATSERERNVTVAGGLGGRTRALLEAIAEIEAGGHVVTTIDGGNGAAAPVRVFGRHLDLGLGAFAIAKRTGARIVPFTGSWDGTDVVCELGDEIATPDEAAAWLERHLRFAPEQISLGLLRRLLFGPPDGAAVADARGVDFAGGEPAPKLEVP